MDIRYIELKTGFHDDGPAWIGKVKASKTRRTIYFNDHAFQRYNGGLGNFYDVETGEIYWISGIKKNGQDRHWAGKGKVVIDEKVVDEYLALTGAESLDSRTFTVVKIEDNYPVERGTSFAEQKAINGE